MSDIVFMDTETLGLDPDAPIWEFAAIRREWDGTERQFHCFIDHYPLPWIDTLPDAFASDYRARYIPKDAVTQFHASQVIKEATSGAHIVGAVPSFDTERLQRLLQRVAPVPHARAPWHYHLIDIENVVVGFLTAQRGSLLLPPYKSDELSLGVGVDPSKFPRHTAMGDVQWIRAQWDAISGGVK